MLNEEINKYKELYSQLVSEFAKFHNHSLVFVKSRARDVGFAGRRNLRTIESIIRSLKKQSQLVYKENLANIRAEKKLKKETRVSRKRTTPMPRKPKKEIKNDNNQ
jgi:hypothetical protein